MQVNFKEAARGNVLPFITSGYILTNKDIVEELSARDKSGLALINKGGEDLFEPEAQELGDAFVHNIAA